MPYEERHCPEDSKEGESSEDSGVDGSGGCPCCRYLAKSLMIQCQHRCALHLSRSGWQHLGFQHIPSLLSASPKVPVLWPVFYHKNRKLHQIKMRNGKVLFTHKTCMDSQASQKLENNSPYMAVSGKCTWPKYLSFA